MDTKPEGKTIGCLDCKHKSDLFKLLTDEELSRMDKNRFEVSFRAGETIRKQGTNLSHVLSINSGLCKLYIEGQNNQNIILRIIKPINFIGGPGMYADQRHHYSVAALTDASVCFIDMKVFKDIIHENNKFADEFIRDLSRNTLSTYSRLLNLTQNQMPGENCRCINVSC